MAVCVAAYQEEEEEEEGGGADGRCCSGWDERCVKEAQSANCSGSQKGCALRLKEREAGRLWASTTGS